LDEKDSRLETQSDVTEITPEKWNNIYLCC